MFTVLRTQIHFETSLQIIRISIVPLAAVLFRFFIKIQQNDDVISVILAYMSIISQFIDFSPS